jgi:ankyrin repeat protein/L-ascorbate metabolism protein UlaG (beta-lactamase superfamily)
MFHRAWLLLGICGGLCCANLAAAGDIHRAIAHGDRARVQELLAREPQLVRAQDSTRTRDLPLHAAAAAGAVDIAQLLLGAGAVVDCEDADGSTPLHVAAIFRKRAMVDFLLAQGADPQRRDRNGGYSLSFAVSGGDSTIMRTVLAAGADWHYVDRNGTNTLMHLACMRGLFWFVDELRAQGMDMDVRNRRGETPLHWICTGRHPERIEPALARGAALTATDSLGRTPLAFACWNQRPETAGVLLAHGADSEAPDRAGNTPLFAAVVAGCTDCVRLLLEHGARAEVRTAAGQTPLAVAAERGAGDVVALLLAAGARPAGADSSFSWTMLHTAAALGYQDIARSLVASGADLEIKDKDGRTPLQLAQQYGQRTLAASLKEAGATGKVAAPAAAPAGRVDLGSDDARIWYLGHSGWAVKTAKHFLVFDFGDIGRRADEPCLASGDIDPREIAGEQVTVFASHAHPDHYMASIFDWRTAIPEVHYVCGFRPPILARDIAYEFIEPRQTRTIDGMRVTTLRANDSGVGFLVEVDGLTIFHPGDHTRRTLDASDGFQEEIDVILQQGGVHPDIAFIPLSGCGMTDQTPVRLGTEYILTTMQPKVLFPMHGGCFGARYTDFIAGMQGHYPHTQLVGARCKGDHFRYRKGKVS